MKLSDSHKPTSDLFHSMPFSTDIMPLTSIRPGVVFAMRYPDDVGYVWSTLSRCYNLTAKLLISHADAFVAYPVLTGSPAYTHEILRLIHADFYNTAKANRSHLRAVVAAHHLRVVIFVGCSPSEVSLRFLHSLGLRTINGEQDSYPVDARQSFLYRALKYLFRSKLHYNIHDAYVANAEHQRDFLLSFAGLPPDRVHVARNGIDTDLFTPGAAPDPSLYGLPQSDHYIVSISQARPEKRVDFLLRIAERFFNLRPSASLTFIHVGDGPCLSRWREEAKSLGLENRFCFMGGHKDVVPFHRLASVFVHAAERESFGYVLAEAMACEKPIVATDAPGPREIIADGETGCLVGKNDLSAFVNALLRLIDNHQLRLTMGFKGRQRAVDIFSLGHTAKCNCLIICQQLLLSSVRGNIL